MQRTLCAIVILVVLGSTLSQDIFELTTRLDDPRVRFLFHGFRNFVFNSIGMTGQKTKGVFLQEKFPDSAAFPCDVSIGRSKTRPHSIHKLRPGGNLFWPDGFLLLGFYPIMLWACLEINGHLCCVNVQRLNQLITYFFSRFKTTAHYITKLNKTCCLTFKSQVFDTFLRDAS